MYTLVILAALLVGGLLVRKGLMAKKRALVCCGSLLVLGTIAFFYVLSLWGDVLWFEALGYRERFWTIFFARMGLGISAAALAGLTTALLTWAVPSRSGLVRVWPAAVGAIGGFVWGFNNWDALLTWWYHTDVGLADPIIGRDVGFYMFSLPLFDAVYWLLLGIGAISFLAAAASCISAYAPQMLPRRLDNFDLNVDALVDDGRQKGSSAGFTAVFVTAAFGAFVLGMGTYLNTFHLLFSEYGAVHGAGWTDANIVLPAYYILAIALLSAGAWFVYQAIRCKSHNAAPDQATPFAVGLRNFIIPIVGLAGLSALATLVVPGIAQWLWVSPNEITVEQPYIQHNIDFTRRAFGLQKVETRQFPVSETLNRQTLDENEQLLAEIRLWDHRALLSTYEQFQEIRLYYEFSDVDIDRYHIDSRYRQVMMSPREIEVTNLPRQSQTFVNRHFKYTHGYGLTMAPVSDFTSEGLPNLLVKDLPPQTTSPQLEVTRPQIYYGEHTDEYAVVNTHEAEFDYPAGDKNAYNHYEGTGGVRLNSLWRKFLYGWKLDGTRFLFSSYPHAESRVQFRRNIRERVRRLAPFLVFDNDPYIVLHDGQLYWVIDAYTTSDRFPYSEPLDDARAPENLRGGNYLRNSIKAIVDAYDGSVDFYVFEPQDPVIQVWQRIFPRMFKAAHEMPPGLKDHVRYPEGLLTVQGAVYSKYHMTDSAVFYNQEDLWVPATEKYYSTVRPVEPYYVMWSSPDSEAAEFILMQPFTPKNRQVMIGWIAGMCDGDNYGRLLAYRFPKEKRILGPQQVETKIDQDRFLSGQLTLWDQRGSNVIRGNLLVIPIGETLLYVEPIYLQAEAAAYPELRLVVVMHDDRLSYAETFDEALQGLFDEKQPQLTPTRPRKGKTATVDLARQANESFDAYIRYMGNGRFELAADELRSLQQALKQMLQEPLPTASETAGRDRNAGSDNVNR